MNPQHPLARTLVTVRTWPFVIDVGVAACGLAGRGLPDDDLAAVQARRHARGGIDEPGTQPEYGVLSVTLVAGEQVRRG